MSHPRIVLLTLLILPAFASVAQEKKPASPPSNTALSFKIINAPEGTYGYDIYLDGRMHIHQPSIPGRAGVRGFVTKADAEKVARLVIGKIRKGESPPGVTQEELKKLIE